MQTTRPSIRRRPVGTGAFKWGQRVAGDHLELIANTEYFGEGPHIEKLVFKYIPDLTVLYTQFKSGDIDLVGQPYITPDHYGEAKTLPNRVVTLVPRTSFESFYLNLERPQFKELACVRRSMRQLIRKRSSRGSIMGCRCRQETFMPRQSFFFNPNLPLHQFDLNRASKILDQAGWARGGDGIRTKNCQSAFDWDPLSASKRDPFDRRALLGALGSSELV
ncbi:ABC transporter substrate-binding protein, partial [Bradyrhizobium sp. 147]|uniref:ABC transporter substrate-binding protein n=1 Tax=Bradyrhizobium sp. 147 TaxID=2782623 RepID=UPI0032083EF3